jgi:hypothetical protein
MYLFETWPPGRKRDMQISKNSRKGTGGKSERHETGYDIKRIAEATFSP